MEPTTPPDGLPPEPGLRDGHTIACTAAKAKRLGYWTARDPQGYEYIVGHSYHRRKDGTAKTVETDCWGRQRCWEHDKAGNATETSPDLLADQWAAAVPAKLRSKRPWTLPGGGEPVQVGNALHRLRGWAQTYLAGQHQLSVWLHGEPGRGKTQAAVWAAADLTAGGKRVMQVDVAELQRRLRETYGADTTLRRTFDADLQTWIEVEVLILDDVGAEAQAEDMRSLLFQVIDRRQNAERVTLATSNLSIEDLRKTAIDPRLVSRLSAYQPIWMAGPDHRVAKATAQSKLAI